ncbi:MAG: adenylate/guanylate cyclase domain-containing protein, partial [Deltaproteobacteria bacterium]|nr:adenylate/guanylate cyclase domain-containing protein [Deltaproteobacteria bacterium]
MSEKQIKRKLAAVLHADVKGYSRLMGEDELATLNTLRGYREVLFGLVQVHGGRVVDTAGDGFL